MWDKITTEFRQRFPGRIIANPDPRDISGEILDFFEGKFKEAQPKKSSKKSKKKSK